MAWYKVQYEITVCKTGELLRLSAEIINKPWWKRWSKVEEDLHYIGVGKLLDFEPGTVIVTKIRLLNKTRLSKRLNYPLRGV